MTTLQAVKPQADLPVIVYSLHPVWSVYVVTQAFLADSSPE